MSKHWKKTTKRMAEKQVGWYRIHENGMVEFVTLWDAEHDTFVSHQEFPLNQIDIGTIEHWYHVQWSLLKMDEKIPLDFFGPHVNQGSSWEIEPEDKEKELAALGIDLSFHS